MGPEHIQNLTTERQGLRLQIIVPGTDLQRTWPEAGFGGGSSPLAVAKLGCYAD